jgi:hypothetical protein
MTLTARQPFAQLSTAGRRRTLWASAAASVAVSLPLVSFDRRMRRTGGPGIIPF